MTLADETIDRVGTLATILARIEVARRHGRFAQAACETGIAIARLRSVGRDARTVLADFHLAQRQRTKQT